MASLFGDLLSAFSSKPAENAAQAQIAGLQQAQNTANANLNQGLTSSNAYLGNARDLYGPLAALAGQGSTAYANALGLNGQAGSDSARAAFTGLPGYQEGYNLGLVIRWSVEQRRAVSSAAATRRPIR